jgi:glutaredoxin
MTAPRTPSHIRLFIKPGCGWCYEAMDWLQQHRLPYEELDVISNPSARREMVALSGQTLAPVIEVDGEVLADFDVEELEAWWAGHGWKQAV